jgi:membrane protease subunit HflK
MSDDHEHPPGARPQGQPGQTPASSSEPQVQEDAGSQALAEAFRSSFFIVQVAMVILVVVFLCSGVFSVGPQEKAVILRLGRPVGEGSGALLGAGLHWAFPRPFDEVRRIPFTEIQTVTSDTGWYYMSTQDQAAEAAGTYRPSPSASLDPKIDGYVMTGDGNIIHARATLRYTVDDPFRYEFDFVNASNSVRDALDEALIYATARFTNVDDVLRRDQARFQETVQLRVAQLAQQEDLGVSISQCVVYPIVPPVKLQPDFERVTTALSASQTVQNEAETERNGITNAAAAEANRRVSIARADATNLVASVKADADNFTALLPQYRENPWLVRSYLYYQAMSAAMTNVSGKWFVPENPGGQPAEIRIQLSRPPFVPGASPAGGP